MQKLLQLVGGLGFLLMNGAWAAEREFMEPPVDEDRVVVDTSENQQDYSVEPSISDDCSDVKITGYLDGSYNYLQRSNQFISGVYDREFDIKTNGFTFQKGSIQVEALPEQGWGSLVNVIIGRDALRTAPYGYNPDIGSNVGVDPLQAYLQYAVGPLTVMGGRYFSLAGFEQIDPTNNFNFSDGLLATFAQPGTHLGMRAKYAFAKQWDVFIGVNDGWDTIRDWSRDATGEVGISFNSPDYFNLSAQIYSGEQRAVERSAVGPMGRRNLFDIFATWHVLEHFTVAANFDYAYQENTYLSNGTLGKSSWEGIAAYCNYDFNETWRAALRGEDFSDKNGYRTGVAQTLREITFTIGYKPFKNTELRFETRRDFSNVNSYVKRSGSTTNNQQSFAVEAIYQFGNNLV